MKRSTWLLGGSVFLWAILGSLAVPAAAQVTVTSAVPNNAPQGSTNLIVKIGGSGFKKGAKASFYVSGTTDPGGITVNSVAFVNSKEVDANITVSSTAAVSGFDIYVTSGGRTGKGTDLFTVTSNPNANQGCVSKGPATGWALMGAVNTADSSGNPLYSAGKLGLALSVQLVSAPDANGNSVPQFYVGMVGSGSGAQTVAFVVNLDGSVRRSWLVLTGYGSRDIEVGDVNGDGAPDFVMGSSGLNAAHVFIGHLTGSAAAGWDYNIDPNSDVFSLPVPAGAPSGFGNRVAMGDLNGDGADEIVVSDTPGKTTRHSPYGYAYIYASTNSAGTAWNMVKTIPDPGASAADHFGSGLAIGKLTTVNGSASGTPIRDLAVAANDASLVYIFQDPLGSGSLPTLTYSVPGASAPVGNRLGVGDVNGDGFPDFVAVGGTKGTQEAEVFAGPLYQTESPMYTLFPDPSLAEGWGSGFGIGDIDGDGRADILIGAPDALYSSQCTTSGSAGVAYVYRTGSNTLPGYSDLFEVPVLQSTFMGFGFTMAAAPFTTSIGQPIILIGETGAQVGTLDQAGQVYIYRKTQ